jgi:hypothetical protein
LGESTLVLLDASQNSANSGDWLPEVFMSLLAASRRLP